MPPTVQTEIGVMIAVLIGAWIVKVGTKALQACQDQWECVLQGKLVQRACMC